MGKYAIYIVFALTFALINYSQGLRKVQFMSDTRIVDSYSSNQAQNIAQSTALSVVNRIQKHDDETLIPDVDESFIFPQDGVSFQQWNDMSGSYRLNISNLGDSLLVVQTIGRFEDENYPVNVTMGLSNALWEPNLTHAVFSEEGIDLTGSSAIFGDAGTNSVITGAVAMNGNPRIQGALSVGPGGLPDDILDMPNWANQDVWVPGGVTSLAQPLEFELPPFPAFQPIINPGSSISLSGSSSLNVPGTMIDNVYIPEINIQSNTVLTLDTQGQDITIHVGNLNIQQGHFNIIGGGNVTFNVEDNITLNGSSTLNSNGAGSKVSTYYKGSNKLNFAGNTNYNSSMYAETADIQIAGSGGIQGHIISGGNKVEVTGNAEAISRVIFAPEAAVELSGSGRVRGAIVSKSFKAVGNTRVFFEDEFEDDLPEFLLSDGEIVMLHWN